MKWHGKKKGAKDEEKGRRDGQRWKGIEKKIIGTHCDIVSDFQNQPLRRRMNFH